MANRKYRYSLFTSSLAWMEVAQATIRLNFSEAPV